MLKYLPVIYVEILWILNETESEIFMDVLKWYLWDDLYCTTMVGGMIVQKYHIGPF